MASFFMVLGPNMRLINSRANSDEIFMEFNRPIKLVFTSTHTPLSRFLGLDKFLTKTLKKFSVKSHLRIYSLLD
jgi:hypothetical protein